MISFILCFFLEPNATRRPYASSTSKCFFSASELPLRNWLRFILENSLCRKRRATVDVAYLIEDFFFFPKEPILLVVIMLFFLLLFPRAVGLEATRPRSVSSGSSSKSGSRSRVGFAAAVDIVEPSPVVPSSARALRGRCRRRTRSCCRC